jgi:uncharacterized membrane protein YphA (DoxX/SURF4 family)
MQIVAIIVQVLLALGFFMAGRIKVVGAKQSLQARDHLSVAPWFWRLTGFLELAGALGMLVGIFVPFMAALAGIGFVCVLVGAFYLHISRGDGFRHAAPTMVLLVLSLVVVVLRWGDVIHIFTTRA